MQVKLETERLILRQWQDDDYDTFAQMTADNEVMKYFPNCLSRIESDKLANKIRDLIDKNGWGFWAVELKSASEFIGFVGLHKQEENMPNAPFIEVGWRLDKQYWRRGYATEAAQAAIQFAFEELKQDEVFAFTTLDNIPSQKVMEKLGMINTKQDFDHPQLPATHPMARHCLYKIDKQ